MPLRCHRVSFNTGEVVIVTLLSSRAVDHSERPEVLGTPGAVLRRAAERCWTSSGRAVTGFSDVNWQLRPKLQPSASGAGTGEFRCYHRLQRC
ncbi:hypothetical protein VPH35_062881 [Triticum aestivum]